MSYKPLSYYGNAKKISRMEAQFREWQQEYIQQTIEAPYVPFLVGVNCIAMVDLDYHKTLEDALAIARNCGYDRVAKLNPLGAKKLHTHFTHLATAGLESAFHGGVDAVWDLNGNLLNNNTY